VDDGKGVTSFKRGMTTVFRDVGQRLDVQRVDSRDIEAALRVAAQKFDTDKGLLLTGDTAFKACAAEIAGRMGLKLRNTEPEVLAAWEKGRQQQAHLALSVKPSVERGIAGDVKEPGVDRAHGEQILVVEAGVAKAWGSQIEASGAEFVAAAGSQIHVKLPDDRTAKALEAWRGLPHEVMQAFAQSVMSKPEDMQLADKDRKVLVERQMLNPDGSITPTGMDVILVRDDHVLRSRLQPELKQVFAPGAEIKTAHEFVRQAQGDLAAGQTHATAQEQSEKSKEITQVKEQERDEDKSAERKSGFLIYGPGSIEAQADDVDQALRLGSRMIRMNPLSHDALRRSLVNGKTAVWGEGLDQVWVVPQAEKAKEFAQVKERSQERESEQQRDERDERDDKPEAEREPEAVQQVRKRSRARNQDVGMEL